ncbi:MAG: hypothetical protein OEY79_02830 [Anaplasmataceae bacterium]|nr:hypothetical protein [Anaplasmataceae bacterium]
MRLVVYSIFNKRNSNNFLEYRYGLSSNTINIVCLIDDKKYLNHRDFIIYNGDQINFFAFDKYSIDSYSVAYKIDSIIPILKDSNDTSVLRFRQKVKILAILLLDCIRQIISFYIFHIFKSSIVKLRIILTLLFVCGFFQNIRYRMINLHNKKISNIIAGALSNNRKTNTKCTINNDKYIAPLEIIKMERLKKHAQNNIALYKK